jgi:hypothetical protein
MKLVFFGQKMKKIKPKFCLIIFLRPATIFFLKIWPVIQKVWPPLYYIMGLRKGQGQEGAQNMLLDFFDKSSIFWRFLGRRYFLPPSENFALPWKRKSADTHDCASHSLPCGPQCHMFSLAGLP